MKIRVTLLAVEDAEEDGMGSAEAVQQLLLILIPGLILALINGLASRKVE